jgi:hypothetical protein
VKARYVKLPLPWRERIEVRGNNPRTFFHPHPDPLLSREREIFVRDFIGGKRGIFIAFSLDRRFQNP